MASSVQQNLKAKIKSKDNIQIFKKLTKNRPKTPAESVVFLCLSCVGLSFCDKCLCSVYLLTLYLSISVKVENDRFLLMYL